MSKPGKIFTEAKKSACCYSGGAYSKVRVGSYGAKKILLLTGAAGKDREGKQRQRRQTKTEKANKDREGKQRQRRQAKTEKAKKQTNWYIQRCSYLTTADGQLPYKEPSGNTASRHSGLLRYLSAFSLVKRRLCQPERFPCQSYLFSKS